MHPEANCVNGLLTIITNVNDEEQASGQAAAVNRSLHAVRWTPVENGRVK